MRAGEADSVESSSHDNEPSAKGATGRGRGRGRVTGVIGVTRVVGTGEVAGVTRVTRVTRVPAGAAPRTELLVGIFLRESDAAVLRRGEDRGRDHIVIHALGRAAELRLSQERGGHGYNWDQIAIPDQQRQVCD